MVRRTKEEAQATRSGILDAAELLFHRHGVSRTSLNDIATQAGVTRGAIYWHFKDKADLFNEMMSRAVLPLEEALAQELGADAGEPLDAVRRHLIHALRTAVEDPRTRRVFEIATHKVEYVDELLAVRDRQVAGRNEFILRIEGALRLAVQRGQLHAGRPPRTMALGLHAIASGLLQNWMLDPTGFDLLAVGPAVVDAYLTGLMHPPLGAA